jgi:outer membrane protein, heavy metal efflux system
MLLCAPLVAGAADKPFWKLSRIRIGPPPPAVRPEVAPPKRNQPVATPLAVDEPPPIQLTSQAAPEPLPPEPMAESSVAAATPDGISLEFLTSLAETHHPRLTTAYQQVQSARGRALQAGLYPNPVVASGSPQAAGRDSQYNAFVTQDLVTAGKLRLDVDVTCREIQQAEFAWQQARIALLTDLRRQFYVTLAAQTRVEVLESLVEISRRSRDVSQRLLDAGEGTRGDTLLFDIELDRAEVTLANARTILDVGKRQLAILAAVPDMAIDRLAGGFHVPLPDYDIDQLRYSVASINPQANIARLEIARQATRLRRAEVEPVPNINFLGGYQRQIGNPEQDQGLFQVMVEVPLFDRNQGQIFATQAELAGARADVQRIELALGNEAAAALANYRAAGQLVDRYEQQMQPKARETLRLSQQLYEQGQIDFLRLLQAQKTLLEVELARVAAQEERWLAAVTIAGLLQQVAFP